MKKNNNNNPNLVNPALMYTVFHDSVKRLQAMQEHEAKKKKPKFSLIGFLIQIILIVAFSVGIGAVIYVGMDKLTSLL